MEQAIVRLSGVTKAYRLGTVPVPAIRGIDLEIGAGEFAALAGPSGSGKTTLLNIIGCVDTPDSGSIEIAGQKVSGRPLHRLARTRLTTLGYIFQTFNLLPVLSAFENIEYPLILAGVPRSERRTRVTEWLERVDLASQAAHRPDQMSGGQRQRVAIARAMVGQPKLVLADEPTANLDSETASRILDLLEDLNETTGCTFLFSTHDTALMARARRQIRIRDGRIVSDEAQSTLLEREAV